MKIELILALALVSVFVIDYLIKKKKAKSASEIEKKIGKNPTKNNKKRIVFFTFFIITISSLGLIANYFYYNYSFITKNDLTERNLKGNVKSTTVISFDGIEKFGKIVKGKRRCLLNNFTNQSTRNFDPNMFEVYEITTKFNMNGNQIEYNRDRLTDDLIYDPSLRNIYDEKYNYDSIGRLIEENKYVNDIIKSKILYAYNDNGKPIETNSYGSTGVLQSKILYSYNDIGKLIEKNSYGSDGSIRSKENYIYNNDGYIIEEKRNEDGYLVKRDYLEQYDKNDNRIIFGNFTSEGNFKWKWFTQYDRRGKKIESNKFENNCKDPQFKGSETDLYEAVKKTIKYNQNEDVIEEKMYSTYIYGEKTIDNCTKPPKTLYKNERWEYRYDKNKNWITKIYFSDDLVYRIDERKIEYY